MTTKFPGDDHARLGDGQLHQHRVPFRPVVLRAREHRSAACSTRFIARYATTRTIDTAAAHLTRDPNVFTANENVSAGYAMLTIDRATYASFPACASSTRTSRRTGSSSTRRTACGRHSTPSSTSEQLHQRAAERQSPVSPRRRDEPARGRRAILVASDLRQHPQLRAAGCPGADGCARQPVAARCAGDELRSDGRALLLRHRRRSSSATSRRTSRISSRRCSSPKRAGRTPASSRTNRSRAARRRFAAPRPTGSSSSRFFRDTCRAWDST